MAHHWLCPGQWRPPVCDRTDRLAAAAARLLARHSAAQRAAAAARRHSGRGPPPRWSTAARGCGSVGGCVRGMTLLGVSRKLRACRADALLAQPPDCTCDVCQREIGSEEHRRRCACTACDDIHVCGGCAAGQGLHCPRCSSAALYQDRGSGFLLRSRVFAEAFAAGDHNVVHPRTMLLRALDAYRGRPLLGEVLPPLREDSAEMATPSVQWFSYAECGHAARKLAAVLQRQQGMGVAVVICATNSAGWLLADWACVLAGMPSIVADGTAPPAVALAAAQAAAQAAGLDLGAVIADPEKITEWRRLLQPGNEKIVATPEPPPELLPELLPVLTAGTVVVLSTTEIRRLLPPAPAALSPEGYNQEEEKLHAETEEQHEKPQPGQHLRSGENEGGGGGGTDACSSEGLITCLFSFGSTGDPKPLWFSPRDWAEWGERNPPASKRGRVSLSRRSLGVGCAALFAPLSHGLARRTAWGELLHGGRLGLCRPRDAPDLLAEIAAVAPTALAAAPRFFALFRRSFELKLAAGGEGSGGDGEEGVEGRTEALAAVRRQGGPRLRLIAVGGAVVPRELLDFLRDCFGTGGGGGGSAIVSDGYGMTEVPGGIARDGRPMPGVHIRIVAAAAAAAGLAGDGLGEILVKTSRGRVICGSGSGGGLDAEGWFHTGDLGYWEDLGPAGRPDRRLRVVDRAAFAVKLANGEFLAPQVMHISRVSFLHCCRVAECRKRALLSPTRHSVKPLSRGPRRLSRRDVHS